MLGTTLIIDAARAHLSKFASAGRSKTYVREITYVGSDRWARNMKIKRSVLFHPSEMLVLSKSA